MRLDALLQAATFLQAKQASRETGGAPIRTNLGVCRQGGCTAVVLLLHVWQRAKQGECNAPSRMLGGLDMLAMLCSFNKKYFMSNSPEYSATRDLGRIGVQCQSVALPSCKTGDLG